MVVVKNQAHEVMSQSDVLEVGKMVCLVDIVDKLFIG